MIAGLIVAGALAGLGALGGWLAKRGKTRRARRAGEVLKQGVDAAKVVAPAVEDAVRRGRR